MAKIDGGRWLGGAAARLGTRGSLKAQFRKSAACARGVCLAVGSTASSQHTFAGAALCQLLACRHGGDPALRACPRHGSAQGIAAGELPCIGWGVELLCVSGGAQAVRLLAHTWELGWAPGLIMCPAAHVCRTRWKKPLWSLGRALRRFRCSRMPCSTSAAYTGEGPFRNALLLVAAGASHGQLG